ncbi:hypothetical protein Syun_018830 [Stephania yunnanensis]|uniref:Uncharacterized protein n=1 Tax=Stephania yunnanensis TaxID=152371 RepID=A0AAP0ISZ7_9MAGN
MGETEELHAWSAIIICCFDLGNRNLAFLFYDQLECNNIPFDSVVLKIVAIVDLTLVDGLCCQNMIECSSLRMLLSFYGDKANVVHVGIFVLCDLVETTLVLLEEVLLRGLTLALPSFLLKELRDQSFFAYSKRMVFNGTICLASALIFLCGYVQVGCC